MTFINSAQSLYASARRAGRARQIWAKLRGQQNQLLDLTTVTATCTIGDRRAAGTRIVPIQQIRGSEGRCEDFDAAFRPLKEHSEHRWVSVAKAQLCGVGLPAVELIQLGEVYFVRDGHHRISVAAALGQQEIDAVVTVWHVAAPVREEYVEAPHAHDRPSCPDWSGAPAIMGEAVEYGMLKPSRVSVKRQTAPSLW